MKPTKINLVTVESSLVGRICKPQYPATSEGAIGLWPFSVLGSRVNGTDNRYTDEEAEIVAVYVSDLQDGGRMAIMARGTTTGRMAKVEFATIFVGEAK